MITKERAEAAKDALLANIGREEWSRGAGLTQDEEGSWCVKLNVGRKTEDIMKFIPKTVYGVAVVVDEVGDIVAL